MVGTIRYMSPERLAGAGYGVAADVWSLGVVLLEMAARRLPFDTTVSQIELHDRLEVRQIDNIIVRTATTVFYDALRTGLFMFQKCQGFHDEWRVGMLAQRSGVLSSDGRSPFLASPVRPGLIVCVCFFSGWVAVVWQAVAAATVAVGLLSPGATCSCF